MEKWRFHQTRGELCWERTIPLQRIQATPALAAGRLFVATGTGALHALNTTDGTEIWRWELDAANPLFTPYLRRGPTTLGTPIAAGDRVYIGGADGCLSALDAALAALGPPPDEDEYLDGDVYAAAPNQWKERWQVIRAKYDLEVRAKLKAVDDAAPRSDTAVKSQWEKTLNRDEKSHLGEIHATAERERAAAPRRQAQEKARVAGLARLIGRLEKDK